MSGSTPSPTISMSALAVSISVSHGFCGTSARRPRTQKSSMSCTVRRRQVLRAVEDDLAALDLDLHGAQLAPATAVPVLPLEQAREIAAAVLGRRR